MIKFSFFRKKIEKKIICSEVKYYHKDKNCKYYVFDLWCMCNSHNCKVSIVTIKISD